MELVVLVDEKNNEIGTAAKETVHSDHTPLHRGFSLFLFNNNQELLLTRRADTKKTFPGVWTNTVCGHPAPGEDVVDAAKRRLKDELGLTVKTIKVISPYQYSCTDKNGIMENEICPILVGHANKDPNPIPDEVSAWKWMPWKEFLSEMKLNPETYSPWCIEEAAILQQKDPGLR
jgi:isopentenyl-diphosphate delta-isomerase